MQSKSAGQKGSECTCDAKYIEETARRERFVGNRGGFRVPDSRENFKFVRSICTVASGLAPPIRRFFYFFASLDVTRAIPD